MNLTPAKALQLLKEISAHSERVFFSDHVLERMQERGITIIQVLRCLSHGVFVEEPHRNVKGNWQMTVKCLTAGRIVTTAVALDNDENGNYSIIITVY